MLHVKNILQKIFEKTPEEIVKQFPNEGRRNVRHSLTLDILRFEKNQLITTVISCDNYTISHIFISIMNIFWKKYTEYRFNF